MRQAKKKWKKKKITQFSLSLKAKAEQIFNKTFVFIFFCVIRKPSETAVMCVALSGIPIFPIIVFFSPASVLTCLTLVAPSLTSTHIYM